MLRAKPQPPAKDPAFDLDTIIKETHVFIQWKGTDACLDFHCDCGAYHHIDAEFLYAIKCHKCNTIWEMPSHLFPRKVTTYRGTPYLTKGYDEYGNEL